ncbi:Stearoyl-CoA 9-desaturase [Streptomyces lavendulae subsp. lavendulae]|uniref:Stearoyl-CoA 9-desaturase n=1 Tax=Streptomyces lavendulae subsp. lavendulae TaxID=58340 RepID=A0A2K8PSG4_STRLA|nr:Stearoyl-CoA 9-desaturase [Streptomyces lavendulae subsp. lavendulae]QUQ58400.1 hypothetical protein SLLC_32190 [Streptomyces lavendulae subsp. lavendulae]
MVWRFLRRQVLTSRDVRGGRFTDVVLGGLNHQIEHHLFPSMPSPHLRRARIVVRGYCEELGVGYPETGLVDSYRQTLASLHAAGAPLGTPETTWASRAGAGLKGGSLGGPTVDGARATAVR